MANGTLKVSNIQTSSGSGTITIGQSGETISIPSGATIANSGTATGFGDDNKPAFRATMSSNQTSLSLSTQTLVQFNTETFDEGSCFNTSNYRFVVPSGEAGKYCITAHIHTRIESSASTGKSVRLLKNGSFLTETVDSLDSNLYNTRSNHQQITAIENLSVDDYIEVYSMCWQGSGTGTFSIQTESSFFTAFKLII
tara:strand:- start:290 stop:880 length:591 start_codon:yes stop_codon:yes gene_type:complete